MELLERSGPLSMLDERLASVRATRQGRLVLLAGEAGVGKTSLVRVFAERHAGVPTLTGACEPLFTPRPLGPFLDIATAAGGEAAVLARAAPSPAALVDGLVRSLRAAPGIVVLEDLHWADEATLDALRLLSRRLEELRAVVVATYRDDELHRTHPLRVVLGELPPAVLDRIRIEPLSPAAVARLAGDAGFDALHALTGGNPFFLTEVLAAGAGAAAPQTVRDAVLARAARLSSGARRLLEAVSVVPQSTELWLLEAVAGEDLHQLESCLASGMLRAEDLSVAFRHEIARVAVEREIPPDRRLALHRAVLAALTGRADPARLAHHAEAAGDGPAVLLHARAAGERAARMGAHHEAAAQFARALRHADPLPLPERAELLRRHAYECYLTERIDEAACSRELELACHRALGDRRAEGDTIRWLSRLAWFSGDNAAAEEAARRAIAVLEALPPGPELAMAWSNLSQLRMLAGDAAEAIEWGGRAIDLAERLEEAETLVHALNNVGSAELGAGVPGGREKLERSLALARELGLEEHVARAYTNLAAKITGDPVAAARVLEEGITYSVEHDLRSWASYMRGWLSRVELDLGHWDRAAQLAGEVAGRDDLPAPSRSSALLALGLLRARRGDPASRELLDEVHEIARRTGELQRIAPVAAARAEAAWLAGRPDTVAVEVEDALALAVRRRSAWSAAELRAWRLRAGLDPGGPTDDLPEPYALEIAGDLAGAARWWRAAGCEYSAAVVLAASSDEEELRESHASLQALGARPAAALVARRLRAAGARNVARGPRPSTLGNPAGLTARQLDVLALLAEGARNADIAGRLFLSEKTVDHHVSAILRKLGVSNRSQAGAEAARLGLARWGELPMTREGGPT